MTVYADQPKQLLGKDSAPNPSELLLSALGSCLALSFLKLAACEKIKVTNIALKVKAKIDLRSSFTDAVSTSGAERGFRAICAKFDISVHNDGNHPLNFSL